MSEKVDQKPETDAEAGVEEFMAYYESEKEARLADLTQRFGMARVLDWLVTIAAIATPIIVIVLFTRSLFEGFIGFVVGFFFLYFIFRKRGSDFLSKFRGWFQ